MSGIYSFEIRAFECCIQVTADCLETYTILDRYIFPSLPRFVITASEPRICLRLDRVAGQFQLSVDDEVAAFGDGTNSLVPDLIRALDDAVIRRLTMLRAVHAGAVLWGGRALLLPGSTHAGKSSLVAELLRRGAIYFSDEYALIDSEGHVHPYPRPLLVRNGSPAQSPVLPSEYGACIGGTPAPVGWILSLEYLPECVWNVSAVSQSEALLLLLRNTPHVLSESPDLVPIFQRAVAGATSYVGFRPNTDASVNQILRLINAPL